jgi:hypothetical protein
MWCAARILGPALGANQPSELTIGAVAKARGEGVAQGSLTMRAKFRFDVTSTVLAMRKKFQIRDAVVPFVSVLVVDVEADWNWPAGLLPNLTVQSDDRRVIPASIAMPGLAAPFDASVTHAIIPGRIK